MNGTTAFLNLRNERKRKRRRKGKGKKNEKGDEEKGEERRGEEGIENYWRRYRVKFPWDKLSISPEIPRRKSGKSKLRSIITALVTIFPNFFITIPGYAKIRKINY